MKKRILSLLLVLTLLVTVSAFAVEATEVEQITYAEAVAEVGADEKTVTVDLTFWCEHCKANMTWIRWNGNGGESDYWPQTTEVNGEHYHLYVNGDGVDITSKVVRTSICLYLAGDVRSNVANTKTNDAYMFRLYNVNKITDESLTTRTTVFSIMGTGTIFATGDYGNGIVIDYSTNGVTGAYYGNEVNLYSGVTLDASEANADGYGGAVAVDASSNTNVFNMYGGTIKGGSAKYGGNVYVAGSKSTFNMYGGTIENGGHTSTTTNRRGGNVYIASGAFNMYGGTIQQPNYVDNEEVADYKTYGSWIGHNVAVAGGTFVMNDTDNGEKAVISGGLSNYGAGFAAYGDASVTLTSGTVRDGRAFMYGGSVWTEAASFILNGATIIGGQGTGAALGVGGPTAYIKSGTVTGAAEATGGTIVIRNGGFTDSKLGALEISGGTINGGNATKNGGNIYALGPDSSSKVSLTISGGTISGGTATSNGGNIYAYYCNVSITGGIISGGQAGSQGGNIWIRNGNLDMSNATITSGHADAEGGNLAIHTSCTFTMTSGTVTMGTAASGGNLYVYNNCKVNLNGGYIVLGEAEKFGGNVYSVKSSSYTPTVNVDGATIAAGTAGRFGGNIAPWDGTTLTVNSGTITTEYEGVTGSAAQGPNIGTWTGTYDEETQTYAGNVTINLNGGEFKWQGDIRGGAVYVGSRGPASVNLGNADVHDDRGTDTDIFFAGTATVGEGMKNTGVLTVGEAFTGEVVVGFASIADLFPNDDGVINSVLGVANGYTNGGQIIVDYKNTQYPIVGEDTNLVLAPFAIYDGKNVIAVPKTAEAAMSYELGAKQYVKLFNAPNAVLSLTQATTVDFNGNDATVTLNGFKLTGMDSQTDDYTAEGAANVTIIGDQQLNNVVDLTINGVSGQRKYLYLEGGFHRYYLTIDKAGIRTDSNDGTQGPGITYSGAYRGDEVVAGAVGGYGVEFQVNGNKTPYAYETAFAATDRFEGKMLAVHGMMNETYGETEVAAQAYIVVNGETIYSTETVSNNLKTLVENYVADYNAGNLAAAFRAPIAAMVEKYGDAMKALNWNVELAA